MNLTRVLMWSEYLTFFYIQDLEVTTNIHNKQVALLKLKLFLAPNLNIGRTILTPLTSHLPFNGGLCSA